MKTRHSTLISITFLAVAVLSGCAGTRPAPETVTVGSDTARYMQAVQANADKTGADVVWVNPPKDEDEKKKVR